MRGPSRMALLASAFTLAAIVCVGLVLLLSGAFNQPTGTRSSAIGGPFTLTDENGKAVTNETLKGKPYLIFFGFTHCPDVCPTALFEISEIMRGLGPEADKTAALFISVDPERDSPAALKDYLASFDPHIRGLTGSPETIADVARAFRVYYKKVPLEGGDYTMDHTALVYLMGKDGRFIAPFNIKRPAETAIADLRKHL